MFKIKNLNFDFCGHRGENSGGSKILYKRNIISCEVNEEKTSKKKDDDIN